jgi:hypothetical protein
MPFVLSSPCLSVSVVQIDPFFTTETLRHGEEKQEERDKKLARMPALPGVP